MRSRRVSDPARCRAGVTRATQKFVARRSNRSAEFGTWGNCPRSASVQFSPVYWLPIASLTAPGRPERGVAAGARGSQQIAGKCRHRRYSRARPAAGRLGVVRPEAAGIRGSDCNIIPAIPPVLSGTRDYCPRIPGHEFSAVAAIQGSAAPSSRTPGMPGNGLRERLDLAASAASGADGRGTGCAAIARAGADRGARRRAGPRHGRGSRHAISETAGGAET